MTEILLVALALCLGAVAVFHRVWRYFQARLTERENQHRLELQRLMDDKRNLMDQLTELRHITLALAAKDNKR
ncbi:hypothetical protein [Actinokineospora cianjurensis]|uniref:Uncharacterized protein n=1 Tax=Actinokineospora cianjurensis TaxID=585224 RepID=A0A421B9R0_9PSEU|nr:hypothetical protein [Actinokineospora cianjurensis]RLK61069.1 hypothetical protein CLV68_1584 [Actinokineospora cianjurensis]